MILATLLIAAIVGAQQPPAVLQSVGIDQRLGEQVPMDLVFRDETGKAVEFGDLVAGKPTVLSLVYYRCPMLCGLVLNGMVRSFRVLSFEPGKDFNVISVSFDPGETPALASAKKLTMLDEYRRPGDWHFLTGDEASIRRLADAVGFRYIYDPESKQFAHAAGIMVLTPQGKVSRYFYGVEYSARDLRLALVEASSEKIGSVVDEILLYCFHYDPATGRYSLLITRVVQIAGVVTVVALAGFVSLMLRRENRQA
ncbi:MAG TPA: SCO family protein [Verrucomicrobiae bacterium]|nr:SCO family protein [Verrucomicrobiae bacterium]